MTLIEMVRKTRANRHRHCGVDADGFCHSGNDKRKGKVTWLKFNDILGKFDLKECDWKDTLIDVNKIMVK